MKYECVIFDLDGTLLDTLDDLTGAVNAALSYYGYPKRTREEIRSFIGNGVRKLMERSIPEGKDNPDYEAALSYFRDYYRQHNRDETKPYDGVLSLLKRLKAEGISTAVASNKFHVAVNELCYSYFGKLLTTAFGEDEEHGIKRKPNPDMVLAALDALGVSPEKALYVGDSEVDAQTAKNAGLDCVLVSWGFREKTLLSGYYYADKSKAAASKERREPLVIGIADRPGEIMRFVSVID